MKRLNIFYYNKKNPKIRHSINFIKGNKFIENNKNKIIYEKNFNSQESSSFSINKKEKKTLIHSRNYSLLDNKKTNFAFGHSTINKKIKNDIFLLSQKNLKNSLFQTRKNSYGTFSISGSDCSTKRTIKKIKEVKIYSPFCKSKILNKNSIPKKYILNNQSSSVENTKIKTNKSEKYDKNDTFISSNKIKNNYKFTIFCNYDSQNEKNKNRNKEKIINSETNKIKVNTSNNIKYSQRNTSFMNYKNCKPNFIIEENRGNLTEREKDSFVGQANIYWKKLVFVNNNSNTNIHSSINNGKSSTYRIKNIFNKKNINSSPIIANEKNISSIENKNINNSILIKDKKRYNEYFNDILSKIDLNKNINNKKKQKIYNFKKIKTRNYINKTLNINNSNIYSGEKNILLKYKINSFKPKIKYKNKISKKPEKINNLYNTINNSINLEYNNKFRKNPKIEKRRDKISFKRENSFNIPKFKKTFAKYFTLRNNQNKQICKEISIYIEKQNNNKNTNIEKNSGLEYMKDKKEKCIIKNNKLKAINVNKKTIININQFYPSYFIKENENILKK